MVQGLTEFLPISSSGHLVFFQSIFGIREPKLFFDITLHLGTLFSVLIYFRKDILKIFNGLINIPRGEKNREGVMLFLWAFIATIPTGLMGLFFKDLFESLFTKPKIVGVMLMATGFILWITHFIKGEGKSLEKSKWIAPLLIGIAQGVAIIPGISRSGATISMALFCGLERELSGKFSFLILIPAILGATFLEVLKIESINQIGVAFLGMITAFAVGFFSLKFLMKIIRAGRLSNFSYYCWGVGILTILLTK